MLGKALSVALVCLVVVNLPALADNVTPRSQDAAEDAALMKLAAEERTPKAPPLEALLADRPDWSQTPWVKLYLANALYNEHPDDQGLALCAQLRDTYRDSKPLVAAWAQFYQASWLVKMNRPTEAAQALKDTIAFADKIDVLHPVLQAQTQLGQLLHWKKVKHKKKLIDKETEDVNVRAWAHMALCAKDAEAGNRVSALWRFHALAGILPPGDRRIAVSGIGLVITEMNMFQKNPIKHADSVAYAEQMLQETASVCPEQKWLLAKGKLTIATGLIRRKSDLPKAERLCREVLNEASAPDLLPEAGCLFAQSLYAQRSFDAAAAAARAVVERYPYSSWSDFAMYLWADSVYNAGSKDSAVALLDQLMSVYPDSGWAEVARTMKEVVWR